MNKQKNKRINFENELVNFETEFNPYRVLNIPNNADLDTIKRSYRKLSLKFHPDKGGDPDKFRIITQSYCYLLKKFQQLNYREQTVEELKENVENFMQEQMTKENIYVDKDNFDIKKFNQVFKDYKLHDVNDDGYGNMMTKDNRLREPEIPNIVNNNSTVFTEKFNMDIFNKEFEENKSKDIEHNEMIIYEEPKALLSSIGVQFQELGQDKINDFSNTSTSSGVVYTDYKKAHSSQLINPDKVKYRQYKNIDELEKEREKITYKMSEQDKRKYILRKQKEDSREQERLRRLADYDSNVEKQYSDINRLFIKNG